MKTDPSNTECIDPNRETIKHINQLLSQMRLTPQRGERAQGHGLTIIAEPRRFVDVSDQFSVTISVFNDEGLRINLDEIEVAATGTQDGITEEFPGRHTDWGDISLDDLPWSAGSFELNVEDVEAPSGMRFRGGGVFTSGYKLAAAGMDADEPEIPETVNVELSDPNLVALLRKTENGQAVLMVESESGEYDAKSFRIFIGDKPYTFVLRRGTWAYSAEVPVSIPFKQAAAELQGKVNRIEPLEGK